MISIDPFVIFMQILNFTVLVWLMKRFLVGPLTQHMEARASKIEKNIKKSEEKLANAEAIEKDKNQQLQDAYHQAKEIREKAQDAAKGEEARIIGEAKVEAQRILENNQKEIQNEFVNAQKALKAEVGNLAIRLSSKIMKKNIDEGTQETLIKEFLSTSQN